jgi:competence protein ComK
LFIEDDYIINPNFNYMVGFFDRNANPCTLVRETERIFVVERSPLEILDDSIRCIGFNLKGAMETAKSLLGNKQMCPVMVNPVYQICVFPIKSSKYIDTIWFNPNHIARTLSFKLNTQVEFTNGITIMVTSKLYSFNNKLQIAEQFRNMMIGRAVKPASFKQGPKKRA